MILTASVLEQLLREAILAGTLVKVTLPSELRRDDLQKLQSPVEKSTKLAESNPKLRALQRDVLFYERAGIVEKLRSLDEQIKDARASLPPAGNSGDDRSFELNQFIDRKKLEHSTQLERMKTIDTQLDGLEGQVKTDIESKEGVHAPKSRSGKRSFPF